MGFTTAQLKDPKFLQELAEKRQVRNINGKDINAVTEPDTWTIQTGIKDSNTSVNESISLNETALIMLGELECAVSTETQSYSLITTCGDTETIDNENIVDLNAFKNTQAAPTSADDKFNVDDPFFNLDDDIPQAYADKNKKTAEQEQPDYVCFVATLSKVFKGTMTLTGSASTTAAAATTTTY